MSITSVPVDLKEFLTKLFPGNSTLPGCVVSSVAAIQRFVQHKRFNNKQLCESFTKYQLTAMHVVALMGDVKRVDILIAAGGSDALLQPDYAGNLPIHLAAIRGDEAMIAKLTEVALSTKKQFAAVQNCHMGTVQSLSKITKPPQPAPQQIVAQFKDKEGNLQPLTAEAYRKLTRSVYCDYVQSSHHLLVKEWLENTPKQDPRFFQTIWERYLRAPPQIYLEEQAPMGTGVCAGGPIPQNALILPWGGVWIDPENAPPSSDRKIGTTESIEKGNPASLINDGFPNVFVAKIPLEGCPESLAVYALRPIAQGEALTVNYETHPCKFGHYGFVVKGWERLFNREGLADKLAGISALHAKKKKEPYPFEFTRGEIFKVVQWVAEPLFVLETPRALIHLAVRNLITREDIVTMEKIEACYRSPKKLMTDEMIVIFRGFLKDLLQKISQAPEQEYKTSILKHLDNLFANHRVIVGMLIFPFIKDRLEYSLYKDDFEVFTELAKMFSRDAQKLDQFLDLAHDLLDEFKKGEAIATMKAITKELSLFKPDDFILMTTITYDSKMANICLESIYG